MLPIGIWVARSFKTLDPWWFMGHLALQVRWAQLCLPPAFNAMQCSAVQQLWALLECLASQIWASPCC